MGATLAVALALACTGFAMLGMEILWLRHLAVLLGGFRAVFALLLSVMLVALGAGALPADGSIGASGVHPTLMIRRGALRVTALLGLASGDAPTHWQRMAWPLPTR